MIRRGAGPALALSLACGCAPPLPCGGARASVPAAGSAQLLSAARPTVRLPGSAGSADFLLDTGFRRSALSAGAQRGGWRLAGAEVEADFAPWLVPQATGVLGAEALELLPLALDAAQGTLTLATSFPAATAADLPLDRHALADCADPGVAYTLEAPADGLPVTWLLDTGAEYSVLRTSSAAALSPRAQLSGVVLQTAFAGVFEATARRVAALPLGGGAALQTVVLSSPALDAELDRQSAWLSRAAGRDVQVDGLLGWNALREGTVAWRGDAHGPPSALAFSPYATSPWPRALVGVGVALTPAEGAALEVASVYVPSPAQAAGLRRGDLLETVDGVPAAQAPSPFAAVGGQVRLGILRDGVRDERTVPVADLLPDAKPQ